MKTRLLFNLILATITGLFILIVLLTIKLNETNKKIEELEESNLQVHEYILDRIGA